MSDVVTAANGTEESSTTLGAFASLNEGFLGSGESALVELSYVAMALILGWAALSTGRYLLAVTGLGDQMADAYREAVRKAKD